MKYALIQTAKYVVKSENISIREDEFKLIGIYPTIEAAENERNKSFDTSLYIITQVW